MLESYLMFGESLNGLYNRALGQNMLKLWLQYEEILSPEIEKKCNINLREFYLGP